MSAPSRNMTRRRCTECGRSHRCATDLCQTCRDPDAVELTNGRWVPRGGILVWVADPPPLALVPKPRVVDLADLIACPTCQAKVTEACKTIGGYTTAHPKRLVSRRCPCGSTLEPKRTMCDECREKSRAETYRLREIRKPTRERRKVAA